MFPENQFFSQRLEPLILQHLSLLLTYCPEFKVTAVQVEPVTQPTEWQKQFQQFNEQQLDLLAQAAESERV